MTAGTGATPSRSRRARALRAALVLAVGLLAVLALLIAFPPTSLVKDAIADVLAARLGRPVTIGSAELRFRRVVHLTLADVVIASPPDEKLPGLFSAKRLSTAIALWPLLSGNLDIRSATLEGADLALAESADGRKNWITGGAQGSTSLPPLPRRLTIARSNITYESRRSGASYRAADIDASSTVDPATGRLAARGKLTAKGEAVAFDVTADDLRKLAAGSTSPAVVKLDSRHGKLAIDGFATLGTGPSIGGDLTASTGSTADLARWLGADVAPGGDPVAASVVGKVKATGNDVVLAGAGLTINDTTSRLDGRASFAGPRPLIEGQIATDRLDLTRFSARKSRLGAAPLVEEPLVVAGGWEALAIDLAALERGATSRAAAAAAPAEPSTNWSDAPLNLTALRAVDADLALTAATVAYGALELRNGTVKALLTDGVLDARIETLDVATGKATGTVGVDARASPPTASVALKLEAVPAEPVISEIAGRPLLAGLANVDIEAKAQGQTQRQLAASLEGKARFAMGQGALRGFDVRRMISEWWRRWTFDLARRTPFDRLDAQYDIRRGIMRSAPDLALAGSDVSINSTGSVDVPARRLDQEIRVRVVPPPAALPVPVRISGDWSKPSVGIDWGGLFSSLGGLGGPQSVTAATEPPPPEVSAAIERALAADIPSDRLTDEGRAVLRALVSPPAGASATPPEPAPEEAPATPSDPPPSP